MCQRAVCRPSDAGPTGWATTVAVPEHLSINVKGPSTPPGTTSGNQGWRATEFVFLLTYLIAGRPSPKQLTHAPRLLLPAASRENWAKLAWNVDHEYLLECLDKIVDIRNDLMHFTTDDVDPAQYEAVEGLLENAAGSRPETTK